LPSRNTSVAAPKRAPGIGTIAGACVIAALTLAFPRGARPISQFY
jgi:hypothetical protein